MRPIATTSPLRAATYSHYSSDRQRDASLEDQQRNCHARAEREGWTVVEDFADAAISGSDNQRPQYLAMQAAAERKEFDVLIVDQLSRLARDSVESEQTIRRLEFQDIRIVTTSDGYDSLLPSRKVTRGFGGMMSEIFLDGLSANVHRGLKGQALKQFWCGGKPYGFRLKLLRDPHRLDAHHEPAKIGTVLQIDEQQAAIVKEIFERFVAGESCLAIARVLNERGAPSPGSTWKREVRRCSGWMASAARGILRNPLYTGQQRWNASKFVRDPDTKKHLRRKRPEAEWVTNRIEALRIVSDELFQAAQQRTRSAKESDPRLKNGQTPRYRLSGLLVCASCGAHYVLADARSYCCSSYAKGRACKNASACGETILNRKSLIR
jgi:DNA invertase Pin-like site-specific DNA recombinase